MRRVLSALALTAGLALTLVAGPASADDEEARGDWRFRHDDKPVKVVVLGGSIAAKRGSGYSHHIQQQCANVELENIAKTAAGAGEIKQIFKREVVKNYRIKLSDERFEYWVLHHGGVNSILTPDTNNKHIRELYVLAHERGMKVVGFSVLPWGSEQGSRFQGAEGVRRVEATQQVARYVLGLSTPREALGGFVQGRPDPEADWDPAELPDIGVDLYFDSPLRDKEAELRDEDRQRKLISRDSRWRGLHRQLSDAEREAALEADTKLASETPRWFMRKELHSFDHTHPNAEGHRLIFEKACPQLPESWGCTCGATTAEP